MDRVYHDRRMLKWLPFEALPEQGHYLKAVFDALEFKPRPELSSEQYDYLNWKTLEAFHQQDVIKMEVYQQGKIVIYKGTITKIDKVAGLMRINGLDVAFEDVINIC